MADQAQSQLIATPESAFSAFLPKSEPAPSSAEPVNEMNEEAVSTEAEPQSTEETTITEKEAIVTEQDRNLDSTDKEADPSQSEETPSKTESNDYDFGIGEETSSTDKDVQTQSDLTSEDLITLSEATGSGSNDVKSIVAKVSELKSQLEALKSENETLQSSDPFTTPELKEANEIAKNGGDFREYLSVSQTNWDTVDDDSMLNFELKEVISDDERRLAYIEGLDDEQKAVDAQKYRIGRKQAQQSQMNQLQADAAEQKRSFDTGLKSHLTSIDSLFNLKLNPSDKQSSFDSITNGDFNNSIFFDENGERSFKRMAEAAVLLKRDKKGELVNIKKIVQNEVRKANAKGKRAILDVASNVKTERNGNFIDANPSRKGDVRPLTSYMDSLNKG